MQDFVVSVSNITCVANCYMGSTTFPHVRKLKGGDTVGTICITNTDVVMLIRAIDARISELEGLRLPLVGLYGDELDRLNNLKILLESIQ